MMRYPGHLNNLHSKDLHTLSIIVAIKMFSYPSFMGTFMIRSTYNRHIIDISLSEPVKNIFAMLSHWVTNCINIQVQQQTAPYWTHWKVMHTMNKLMFEPHYWAKGSAGGGGKRHCVVLSNFLSNFFSFKLRFHALSE